MIVRDLVAQLLEMPQDADVRLSCYTVVLSFKDLRAAPGGPLPAPGASVGRPKP